MTTQQLFPGTYMHKSNLHLIIYKWKPSPGDQFWTFLSRDPTFKTAFWSGLAGANGSK